MADAHNTADERGKQGDDSEDRENGPSSGPMASFFNTVVECLIHPVRFFKGVAESDDRWEAMGFAVVMHALGFSGAALWKAILDPEDLTLALIRVIIAPLWVFVSVWLGSELMHWWLGVVGVDRASRSVTHRAVAYCYVTAILGFIPTLPVVPINGIHIGLVAVVAYHVIALKQAHATQLWRAYLAVLLTWGMIVGALSVLFLIEAGGDPLVTSVVAIVMSAWAFLVALSLVIAFFETRASRKTTGAEVEHDVDEA
jgi:hypothetical protein